MRRLIRALCVAVLALRAAPAVAQPDPQPPGPPQPAQPPEPPASTTARTAAACNRPKRPSRSPTTRHRCPRSFQPRRRVSYDKGLTFEAAKPVRAQARVRQSDPVRIDSAHRGRQHDSRLHLLIPRSRLQAEGHVFGQDNRFKLEFSFEDSGSFAFAKDLYVEKKLAASPVWFRAGHWKRPFNRQEIVSDFASELNERANTATFVGGGRDLGVAIHNDYEKSPEGLEWVAGVFNGFSGSSERPALTTTCTQNAMTGVITCTTPTPSNFPADFGPTLVLRAGWNAGKVKGYSEGDLDGGARATASARATRSISRTSARANRCRSAIT